ncbi:MAG TPA: transporter substrate-binding domain-containing protein [Pseudogracilibacillus sp.]|nr:transporter substrate-binding domain-containing protein [Pseudogracilibacillus sp.]
MRKYLALITLIGLVLLVACSNDESASASDVRKVKVAYAQAGKPVSYTDEDGKPTGYDVEVIKAVAEKLPQYEFEFVGTSDDDLLIGVEQGKFQIGLKNAFYTDERAEKFLYPEEHIGLSSIGFVLKKEDEAIETLADFADADYKLAPIATNNAQYAVIDTYNQENPDNEVNLVAGDVFSLDVVQWVLEGRADGGIIIEGTYHRQITDDEAPYKHLEDDLVYKEFDVIETWPLFNREEEDLVKDFDQALKEVKEEGIVNDLSVQFYGKDLFELEQ